MSLKSLKSLFFEEEAAPTAATPVVAPSTPVISNQSSNPPPSPVPDTKALDDKLRQRLTQAIYQARGIEPYKALDDMLDSLEDVLSDPAARYKKAVEILGKQGHSLPVVLNGIDVAIGALEDEAREFEAGQKAQSNSSVGSLHKAVEAANQQIETRKVQLQQLQQEIADLTKKQDTDAAAIAGEQARIDQVQGRFTIIYQALLREVQNQRQAVDQMIKVQP